MGIYPKKDKEVYNEPTTNTVVRSRGGMGKAAMYFNAVPISEPVKLSCGQTLPKPVGAGCQQPAVYVVEMGAGPHKVRVALCEKCMLEARDQASRWEDV